MFLEECKYLVKVKKTSDFTTDDKEISSDDADRENSDEEILTKKVSFPELYNFFSGFASSLLNYKKKCF